MQSTQKTELQTALKKQYSVLKQAVAGIKSKDGTEISYDIYAGSFVERIAQEYIEFIYCENLKAGKGCLLQDGDELTDYYKTLNGKTLSDGFFNNGGYVANDGTAFFFEQGDASSGTHPGYMVAVDVNGYSKKPNRMGVDLFVFQITEDGDVLPMGAKNTFWYSAKNYYCSKSSSSSYNGYTCASHALWDEDYFKKL